MYKQCYDICLPRLSLLFSAPPANMYFIFDALTITPSFAALHVSWVYSSAKLAAIRDNPDLACRIVCSIQGLALISLMIFPLMPFSSMTSHSSVYVVDIVVHNLEINEQLVHRDLVFAAFFGGIAARYRSGPLYNFYKFIHFRQKKTKGNLE